MAKRTMGDLVAPGGEMVIVLESTQATRARKPRLPPYEVWGDHDLPPEGGSGEEKGRGLRVGSEGIYMVVRQAYASRC